MLLELVVVIQMKGLCRPFGEKWVYQLESVALK